MLRFVDLNGRKIQMFKKSMTCIVLCIAALSGCATPPPPAPKVQAPKPKTISFDLNDQQREHAMASVREVLKDPDSAKFSGLIGVRSISAPPDKYSICGKVNAKNSYGGYTGFTRFAVLDSSVILADSTRFNREMVEIACRVTEK
ncbi:hypothetical protein GHV80_16555 [Pseudomonas aeruginosa]|nr:hypothetical protein AO997_17820 [Pseudomonas aeruginosa]MBG4557956.1 hypothetical protein [Pseudomonas aeruginosa]MBG5024084.1 hypothetical protein [Pseudomonas aeruginosa]MBG6317158.1 hypothetical protein [Pseudomonas aeruginosa]MCO1978972.1 hypothetical protein [Pseudomonas aeruginosa]